MLKSVVLPRDPPYLKGIGAVWRAIEYISLNDGQIFILVRKFRHMGYAVVGRIEDIDFGETGYRSVVGVVFGHESKDWLAVTPSPEDIAIEDAVIPR
jgi:hypothetical protein